MGYLFKTIRSGQQKPAGIIDIPFLGAKVGDIATWTLQRRGDTGQEAALYDLHASLSYLSKALWEAEEYPKRFILYLSLSKQYRLEQDPGMKTTLQSASSLLIEGVRICPEPRRR